MLIQNGPKRSIDHSKLVLDGGFVLLLLAAILLHALLKQLKFIVVLGNRGETSRLKTKMGFTRY